MLNIFQNTLFWLKNTRKCVFNIKNPIFQKKNGYLNIIIQTKINRKLLNQSLKVKRLNNGKII